MARFNLIPELNRLIDKEIELAEKGRGGRIILKMNALQDPIMIDRLYEASQKGVKIDLIVRGICCLIPGQEYSCNIRVTRIVDSFLEHARIWYFGNAGHPKVYMGSPDWMRRNLYRRIEAVVPILDNELREEIVDMLHIQLSDNQKACFVDDKLNNIFKFKTNAAPVRAQYTFYNYLKEKNETFLNMYDISLQYENPSFAARNNIHIYGDNLSMYYYLPIRTCRIRLDGWCK